MGILYSSVESLDSLNSHSNAIAERAKAMKTGIQYGIVEKSKTRAECIFCGVCIPNARICIQQHANGVKHKQHVTTMGKNGVRFNNNMYHCKLCKTEFEEGETVEKHVAREDHAIWMAAATALVDGESIDLHGFFHNDSEEILCKVCNCPFSFSLGAIEQHINWFNHHSNVAQKLKLLNGMFPVKNNTELWCKICQAHIHNNTQSVLQHIDDDSDHVGWFEYMEGYINDDGIDFKEYLSSEHKLTVVCRYCHTNILCNIFSIENHIRKHLHQRNIPTPYVA